jgi:Ni2+-binding GTPase involved in maturation of urease and hydrogenase
MLGLLLGLLLFGQAVAGEHSVACKQFYKSDVVKGTAYQNFCLGEKKETVSPTPIKCVSRRLSPLELQSRVKALRALVAKSDFTLIESPENLKMLVAYYFKGLKNVKITSRPAGREITLKLCKEVRSD